MAESDQLILIVEDNAVMLKLAKLRLRKFGLQMHTAHNGAEALRKVQQYRYKLILMDVMMPEIDGLEATRRIRMWEQRMGRRTPIVALTAHADKSSCIEAGMDDFVEKPADYDRIIFQWLPDVYRQVS
jgi:two-component system sensor histidine kinase/response regulator